MMLSDKNITEENVDETLRMQIPGIKWEMWSMDATSASLPSQVSKGLNTTLSPTLVPSNLAPELNMVFDQSVELDFYNIAVSDEMIDEQEANLRNQAGSQEPAQEYAGALWSLCRRSRPE